MRTLAQCALWLALGANASVVVDNVDNINVSTVVAITGEITKGDAATISDLVRRGAQNEKRLRFQYHVLLDSPGGDLDAAMAIGRTLKTTTALVTVNSLERTNCIGCDDKPVICASACVLILAAGSWKMAAVGGDSRVGIHRPYSNAAGATTTERGAARYTAMATRVRAYLEEVGMPARLYEEMMLVPPERMRWLTMDELHGLGLLGTDPAFEDAMDSRGAALRGISRQEWLRRKSLAEDGCLPPKSGPFDSPEYKKWGDCLKHVYDYGAVPR